MRFNWAIVVPASILLLCLSPGALMRSKIERSVEAKAPELLGPAKSYNVSVTGGFFGILRGRLEEMVIHGTDVKLKNGISIDRLDVKLSRVRFKRDQTLSGVDKTTFTAFLSEEHLKDYLAVARSDMKDAQVSLRPGQLVLSARPRVMLIRTPVKLEGTLEIERNTKLNIILKKLSARGIRVPGFVRGRIQHDLNPVLDTTQMGMGMKLTKVSIDEGKITLCGTADVKQALATN